MPNLPREGNETAEWIDPAAPRRARSRGDRARKAFRSVSLVGFLLLVFGFLIGLSAAGPSVPATALVLLGLLLAGVGLVAHRLVFWAEVVAKDRPGHEGGSGR